MRWETLNVCAIVRTWIQHATIQKPCPTHASSYTQSPQPWLAIVVVSDFVASVESCSRKTSKFSVVTVKWRLQQLASALRYNLFHTQRSQWGAVVHKWLPTTKLASRLHGLSRSSNLQLQNRHRCLHTKYKRRQHQHSKTSSFWRHLDAASWTRLDTTTRCRIHSEQSHLQMQLREHPPGMRLRISC